MHKLNSMHLLISLHIFASGTRVALPAFNDNRVRNNVRDSGRETLEKSVIPVLHDG